MNESKLYEWLKFHDYNVNAQLCLNLLDRNSYKINENLKDEIFPYLLVDSNLESIKEVNNLKHILKNELNATQEHFVYLRDKLNLSLVDYGSYIHKFEKNINFNWLIEEKDINELYDLLYIVENRGINNEKKQLLLQILPPLIINNCKSYNLIESAILIKILIEINLNNLLPETFFENLKIFFEEQQRIDGSFGFQDPFIKSSSLKDNDKIIRTFYCYKSIKEIEEVKKDVAYYD